MPQSKKLKLDISVESDVQDDDFMVGSLRSESSDGSTNVEAVLNAEVGCQCLCLSLKAMSLSPSFPHFSHPLPTDY
jgi:hypothetical protein